MEYAIIDIETRNWTNGVLEVASIRIDQNSNILNQIEVRTNLEWPENHISNTIVPIGKYTEEEAIEILVEEIKNSIPICFNLNFEKKILSNFGYIIKGFDLMQYVQRKYGMDKYNLKKISELYGIKQVQPHRALGDILTVYQILRKELLLMGLKICEY